MNGPSRGVSTTANVLTLAYAMDGKAKPKKPRKRKNADIDDQLVVVEPPPPPPAELPKGKRKKKISECPNPLFLGWLEEWKAEAKARDNTNLCYVYGKAIKSLKKYPAVMESGHACAILENFGPKTCKMLDERLAEHRAWLAENGDENGPSLSNGCQNGIGGNPSSTSLTSSSSSQSVATIKQPSASLGPPTRQSPSSSTQLASTSAPAAKKPRRDSSTPRRQREYIPVLRSGAYAILVTLNRALPDRTFLTKKQLMQEAQPLSDTSFQKPDDPDSYYSAWSSMKTLLTKELVSKESCPAKFSLTETGAALARKLESADESFFFAESEASQVGGSSTPVISATGSGCTSATQSNGASRLPSTSKSITAGWKKSDVAASKFHNISLISSDEDDDPLPKIDFQHPVDEKRKGKATLGMKTKGSSTRADPPVVQSLPSEILSDGFQTSSEFPQPSSKLSSQTQFGHIPAQNLGGNGVRLSPISRPPSSPSSSFPFVYLDYDHNEVPDKDNAAVTFDSIVQAGFLVKCRRKDLSASGKRFSPFQDDARRRSLSGGCGGVEDFIMAYLANDDCPEMAPGLTSAVNGFGGGDDAAAAASADHTKLGHFSGAEVSGEKKPQDSFQSPTLLGVKKKKRKKKRKSERKSFNISFDDVLGDSDEDLPAISDAAPSNWQNLNAKPNSMESCRNNSDSTLSSKAISDSSVLAPNDAPMQRCTQSKATPQPLLPPITSSDSPSMSRVKGHQRRRSVQDVLSTMIASPRSKRTSIAPPLFTLRPGSFQVHLIVDTSEVAGGPSKSSGMRKDATAPELDRNGVSYFTRRLAVGDFVWIARENCSPHREVVLDFIVERKRMDDLASSICDGRFREQKHRLKQSGLGHVIYLIEEYGVRQFGNMPEASLRQAISNVQIIDDFHVVNCKDPKAVIGYLSLMTQYLRSLYAGKTLLAVPHATFTSGAKLTLDDAVQHLITFDEFGRVAEKNKDLTSRELFAKQLLVLAGVSADRAFSIVEKFPTPEMLMRAYDQLGTFKDKEDLMKDLKCGLGQRKLGPAISKMLAQMYSPKGPLK